MVWIRVLVKTSYVRVRIKFRIKFRIKSELGLGLPLLVNPDR